MKKVIMVMVMFAVMTMGAGWISDLKIDEVLVGPFTKADNNVEYNCILIVSGADTYVYELKEEILRKAFTAAVFSAFNSNSTIDVHTTGSTWSNGNGYIGINRIRIKG